MYLYRYIAFIRTHSYTCGGSLHCQVRWRNIHLQKVFVTVPSCVRIFFQLNFTPKQHKNTKEVPFFILSNVLIGWTQNGSFHVPGRKYIITSYIKENIRCMYQGCTVGAQLIVYMQLLISRLK